MITYNLTMTETMDSGVVFTCTIKATISEDGLAYKIDKMADQYGTEFIDGNWYKIIADRIENRQDEMLDMIMETSNGK